MVQIAIVSSLFMGLAFGKQQLEPGQWHPAVETDGISKQRFGELVKRTC
jgi:hypothetical protein